MTKSFNYILYLPSVDVTLKLADYLKKYCFRLELCFPVEQVQGFSVSVTIPSFLKDAVVSFLMSHSVNFCLK